MCDFYSSWVPQDDTSPTNAAAAATSINFKFRILIMQVKTFIAAAATTVFATFGAFAQEATVQPASVSSAAVSRADVHAQAVSALAAGQVQFGEASVAPATRPVSVTRLQVVAETLEAKRLGLSGVGEGPSQLPTQAEVSQIRTAGERAAGGLTMAGSPVVAR
jgi:hypothetical protein